MNENACANERGQRGLGTYSNGRCWAHFFSGRRIDCFIVLRDGYVVSHDSSSLTYNMVHVPCLINGLQRGRKMLLRNERVKADRREVEKRLGSYDVRTKVFRKPISYDRHSAAASSHHDTR